MNCDDAVDLDDMIAIIRYVAEVLATPRAGCPPIGSETGDGIHGDVNCDNVADIRDGLTILLFRVGLPMNLNAGCEGP